MTSILEIKYLFPEPHKATDDIVVYIAHTKMNRPLTIEYDEESNYLEIIECYLENNIHAMGVYKTNHSIELTVLSNLNISETLNSKLEEFIARFNENHAAQRMNAPRTIAIPNNINTSSIYTYQKLQPHYKIKNYNVYYNYVRVKDQLYDGSSDWSSNNILGTLIDYFMPDSVRYNIIKYIYRIEFIYGICSFDVRFDNAEEEKEEHREKSHETDSCV